MNLSGEQVIEQSQPVLAYISQLRQEFAEMRQEVRADEAEILATCGRIDGQIKDSLQILRKSNAA